MLVYPEYSKVPSLERLADIAAKLEGKPEDTRNEFASIWLHDLIMELSPRNVASDDTALRQSIFSLLNQGKEINAMKEARARLGCGLKEAHGYVQRLKHEKGLGATA